MQRIKEYFQNEKMRSATLFLFVNAAALLVLFFSVANLPEILAFLADLLLGFFSALSPLFIGLVISYLLSPICDAIDFRLLRPLFPTCGNDPIRQEKILQQRCLLSIILAFLLLLSAAGALVYTFAALILGNLKTGAPLETAAAVFDYFYTIRDTANAFIGELPPGSLRDTAAAVCDAVFTRLFRSFTDGRVWQTLSRFGSLALNLGLGIVAGVYLLKDRSFFKRLWRKFLHLTLPQKHNAVLTGFLHDVDRVLSRFVRGAFLDALIVALLASAALSLYGLPLSVFVGCFAGLTNLIPYFGPILGMIPAFAAGALAKGFGFGAGAVLMLFLIQQLDCNLIYPKIVGRTTGLHPLFILLSVSVMGYYGGIVYMILAVPLAGILNLLIARLSTRA